MSKRIVVLSFIAMLLAMMVVVPAAAEGESPPDATPTEEVTAVDPTSADTPELEVTADPQLEASATPVPDEEPGDEVSADATGPELASLAAAPPGPEPGSILFVKKDAFGQAERTWRWTIEKTADHTALVLSPGQSHVVNYSVTAAATGVDGAWSVSGEINLLNISSSEVQLLQIADTLSDGTAAEVLCPFSFPHSLPAGWTTPPCTYSAAGTGTPPATNTASVYISDGAGGTLLGGSVTVPVVYGAPTSTDECIDVTDSQAGFLGTVCADGGTSFTFDYTWTIGPYAECGDYLVKNDASFVTNNSGTKGSDSWVVDVSVPCAGGCSLTPGYWKTHSSFGPAPYDDTWALVGEDTPFFLSGKSYYQALWTSPSGGNAYWILAHAYIAAKLNQLNGADFTAAQAAFDSATVLFGSNTPGYIGGLKGGSALRQSFLSLATTLDNYNNGLIGPGHCSE